MAPKLSEKLSMIVGATSLAAIPTNASAALVTVSNAPLSVSLTTSPLGNGTSHWQDCVTEHLPWDVDGAYGPDFAIDMGVCGYHRTKPWDPGGNAFRSIEWRGGAIRLVNALNGVGFGNTYGPANLTAPNSEVFDPRYCYTPQACYTRLWKLAIANSGSVYRYYGSGRTRQDIYTNLGYFGNSSGERNLLFTFNANGNMHFGWAVLSLEAFPIWSATIKEWTYETEPETPIHVGSRATDVEPVPLPPAIVPALTMLGMGAVGVRSWRKRKAQDLSDSAAQAAPHVQTPA